MNSCTVDENNIMHCPSGNAWMATLENSIKQQKLVVSMYYAPWSEPSKTMYNTIAELARSLPNVIFCKLDIDEAKDISIRMAIRIVPTILFVREGKEVDRCKSVVTAEFLKEKIESLMNPQQP